MTHTHTRTHTQPQSKNSTESSSSHLLPAAVRSHQPVYLIVNLTLGQTKGLPSASSYLTQRNVNYVAPHWGEADYSLRAQKAAGPQLHSSHYEAVSRGGRGGY